MLIGDSAVQLQPEVEIMMSITNSIINRIMSLTTVMLSPVLEISISGKL